jgi:hypothetical protein
VCHPGAGGELILLSVVVETTERCLKYLDEIGGADLKNRKAT